MHYSTRLHVAQSCYRLVPIISVFGLDFYAMLIAVLFIYFFQIFALREKIGGVPQLP